LENKLHFLITGNRGFIGKYVESRLNKEGHQITGFDIIDGFNILDYQSLHNKTLGCDVIIHLASIEKSSSSNVIATNLVGMWNVLEAGRNTNIKKIIFLSSADALGIFQGEGLPEYLPIDDNYPCHPSTPYAISKKLSEEMCAYISSFNKLPIICIRAPGVWDESTYNLITDKRKSNPGYECSPYWEYGAFIDVRDLAEAILLASIKDISGFHCLLISSDDITTSGMTSKELVDKIHPNTIWKGNNKYIIDPYKSIIDCSKIKKLLNWSPKYSWKSYQNKLLINS
jgi:UDP-glucose 4-epimerase